MLHIDATRVDAGERLDREAAFVVPDIPASEESTRHKIRWRIEVRGRVAGSADFTHRFPVSLNAAAASPPRS
jgi:hypothetical protein